MASIGMPGTVNFIAEIMIIVGSWNKYPIQVIVAMLGIVLTLAYLFKMMRGLFYGPMNQKYSHAHDAVSTVDRLPLLMMIIISIGFGIFPMHLYDVVRSGVDPLVARALVLDDGGFAKVSYEYNELGNLGSPLASLTALRDRLDQCIGCGCLSLKKCRLYNPGDGAAAFGAGPRYLLGTRSSEVRAKVTATAAAPK